MSFVVGEVDVSPDSLGKIRTPTQQLATRRGVRHMLLDSVRDTYFLGSSSIGNPDGTNDGGLGVVDNGIFVYTTRFVPGQPTKARQYPVKFFWIGSPSGTNDSNDNFSIYVADVNPDGFYPGATASEWLVNPRLVVHYTQAKNDIVNWFDSNYPGGASSGVGSTSSGSNSQYGTLGGSGSAAGDVSKMNSIDGQFWPIYDYIDNSIILYFSIKTGNVNTKSIYAYKLTDSEVGSPASGSEFLGGVVMPNTVADINALGVASSHRFSIASPDPLLVDGRTAGQQTAVALYAYGAFDGNTPDHGRAVQAFILSDIHGSPTNWASIATQSSFGAGAGVDLAGIFNPDKLGSIQACSNGTGQVEDGYVCIYNATSSRDARPISNAVVIDAMHLRVLYYHPATNSISFGSRPILHQGNLIIGHCRPQFTLLPDGVPKILFAGFSFDQNLSLHYMYVDEDELQPERQREIIYSNDYLPNQIYLPSYGKSKARIRLFLGNFSSLPAISNPQSIFPAIQIQKLASYTKATGLYYFDSMDAGYLLVSSPLPPYRYDGNLDFSFFLEVMDEVIEDLPNAFALSVLNPPSSSFGLYGEVRLSD
ncbi:MAG TPA: hypothetical protein VFF30_03835 [Nitrososphaerales archaeon]|nr:hypothetical protein [Nitrososphaerales archaeon]